MSRILSSDRDCLTILCAMVMPSEAAAPAASLEWRAIRMAWLDALAEIGMTEEEARRLASDHRRNALTALTLKPAGGQP